VRAKIVAFVMRGGVDVMTKVLADEGPINCCTAPSNGFSYKGQITFDVKAGDAYGFRLSGANADRNRILQGTLKLAEVDATAPVVTHTVTGAKGASGFYSGRVDVKFNVVENDSRILSQSGCDATAVTEDTAGKTITCKVTSRGGTTTDSVTIKRDDTAPALNVPSAVVKQADDASGGVVTYDATATDTGDPNAVVECTPASGARFAMGTTTVTCTARDAAGHSTSKSFDAIVFPAPAAPVVNAGSVMTSKGSTLSLSTLVKASLKGGTTIKIAISASGALTTIKSLAVRNGKAPVVNTCTASGTKPVAC
jgi:hypothetical protein